MSEFDPPTSIDHACDAIEEYYTRAYEFVNGTYESLRLEERWEATKLFLHHHPLLSLFFFILFAVCSFPVLCFTAFAIGSTTFMFITFVFFEGVLLSIGLCVLVAVLSGLTFLALGVSVFVAGTGYMFIIAHKVANSIFLLLQPQTLQRPRPRSRRVSPENVGPQGYMANNQSHKNRENVGPHGTVANNQVNKSN